MHWAGAGILLDSALMRPQIGYYRDLIEEAAALWESLAMIHPFVDGNKRVAYAVTELFVQSDGLDIVPDNHTVERFIYTHLESGTFEKDVLDPWLRRNMEPL